MGQLRGGRSRWGTLAERAAAVSVRPPYQVKSAGDILATMKRVREAGGAIFKF